MRESPTTCEVVPFTPGRRPTDEAAHPGLGSSDDTALVLGDTDQDNRAFVLYTVERAQPGDRVELTLSSEAGPLPGWERRLVTPRMFALDDEGRPALVEVDLAHSGGQRLAIEIDPDDVIAAVGEERFGLEHQFSQTIDVQVRIDRGGAPVAESHATLLCADGRRFGALYHRIAERLVTADTERQSQAARRENPGVAFHPWYPVLRIGMDKADLYMRGVAADIVGKQRFLPDPGWLLRVGLYLELLTGLGVVEAVRDEVGDLLTPAEREAFETSSRYAEIRRRLNPTGWRGCWELRTIAFPRAGTPRAGPVSALNLLRKRRATLAFLHVHHEDLRHAMELAGPNLVDAQETWQRVFRDAERAVMRQTSDAFPELAFLPEPARERVLWHRNRLFSGQDGLFTSACRQYRASMNEVADWAKARSLTDHTGPECIPISVSLLEAHVIGSPRVGALQARDGYHEPLLVGTASAPPVSHTPSEVVELIAGAPVFRAMSRQELALLISGARRLELGPHERFVVQGSQGSSLFVVVDGAVEVLVRGDDGDDAAVATLERGAIVGEMSLLTGAARAATVRAVDGATVYEIGSLQYEPIMRARPELADTIADEVTARMAQQPAVVKEQVRSRVRRLLLGRRPG